MNENGIVEAATCNEFPHDGSTTHSDQGLSDNAHCYSYKTGRSQLLWSEPLLLFISTPFTLAFLRYFPVLFGPQSFIGELYYITQIIFQEVAR